MSDQPTRDEIKEFLDVFRRLDCMREHRSTTRDGIGTFKREDAPVPGVGKTIAWLKGLAE